MHYLFYGASRKMMTPLKLKRKFKMLFWLRIEKKNKLDTKYTSLLQDVKQWMDATEPCVEAEIEFSRGEEPAERGEEGIGGGELQEKKRRKKYMLFDLL
jgi:hypothetical protein